MVTLTKAPATIPTGTVVEILAPEYAGQFGIYYASPAANAPEFGMVHFDDGHSTFVGSRVVRPFR